MPVFKYRSVSEMPRVPAIPVNQNLKARIRAVWNRARLVCPIRPVRGVTRFRTIEEANRARERATLERMRGTAVKQCNSRGKT